MGRPENRLAMLGAWITMVLCLTSVITDMKQYNDYIPIILMVCNEAWYWLELFCALDEPILVL